MLLVQYKQCIKSKQKAQTLDFGFVELNHERTQNYEQQILFNALSCFQIVNVSEQVHQGLPYFLIQMKYGISYEIAQKYHQYRQNLSKQEQSVLPLILKLSMEQVENQISAIQSYPDLQVQTIKIYEKALSFWILLPEQVQILSMNRQYLIQRYSTKLYIFYENKSKELSEITINYLKKWHQHNQMRREVEYKDINSMINNLLRWLMQIQEKNRRQDYDQSKILIQKCRQQINVLGRQIDSLLAQAEKLGSSQLNAIQKMFESLTESVQLLNVQADVNASYYTDPNNLSQNIKKIKQKIWLKYGKHHPKYQQIAKLESVFKQKTKSSDEILFEELWENFALTAMSDSSFFSPFNQTKKQLQYFISQGRYQDALIQIKKYKVNISKKLLKQELHLSIDLLMDPIFKQLDRLKINLEVKKFGHLEHICRQIDYQQAPMFWDSCFELKSQIQDAFPKHIMLMQLVLVFFKTEPLQYQQRNCINSGQDYLGMVFITIFCLGL